MPHNVLITAEASSGTRDSHAKWLFYLLRSVINSALKSAVIRYETFSQSSVQKADFVIGFELSSDAKQMLHETGKTFMDLRIHPLRFLDDIFFSFETNSEAVSGRLEAYRLDKRLCRYHADLVTATVIKLKKDQIVLPNSLLLIGQTEADRVLYDGTKYLSLLDRIDEIKAIASGYDHVYFKPHPYAKNSRYLLRELRKELGDVQRTSANIYHLLANDGVAHVAALNSSVLYEAGHFGKAESFLYEQVFTEKQIGIYGDYFHGVFWSDILSPVLPTVPSTLRIPFQPSRLRKLLNDFWGYNGISDEIVIRDMLKEKAKNMLRFIR